MAKLGFIGFGGPAAHVALLREEAVVSRDWASEEEFLDFLAATLGIFLPSFVMVMFLAPLVPRLRRSPWTGSALDGLNAGAVGLMAGVSVDLARSALPDAFTIVVAAIALLALIRRRANAVVLIGAGAVVGLAPRAALSSRCRSRRTDDALLTIELARDR